MEQSQKNSAAEIKQNILYPLHRQYYLKREMQKSHNTKDKKIKVECRKPSATTITAWPCSATRCLRNGRQPFSPSNSIMTSGTRQRSTSPENKEWNIDSTGWVLCFPAISLYFGEGAWQASGIQFEYTWLLSAIEQKTTI